MISLLSSLIIPLLVLGVIGYGIYKKVNVYDVFVDGAKESFDMILSMFPCMLAMILGINLFLKSNILTYVLEWMRPVLQLIRIPLEILPLALMRPLSGSSSLAILSNLLESFGPDSFIGTLASTLQGSTDTTFYVLTLYFGSIGVKKIRYAMWAGLFADCLGIITGIVLVSWLC